MKQLLTHHKPGSCRRQMLDLLINAEDEKAMCSVRSFLFFGGKKSSDSSEVTTGFFGGGRLESAKQNNT